METNFIKQELKDIRQSLEFVQEKFYRVGEYDPKNKINGYFGYKFLISIDSALKALNNMIDSIYEEEQTKEE